MSKLSKSMARLVMMSAVVFIIAVFVTAGEFLLQYGGSTIFAVNETGSVNVTETLHGFALLNGSGATVDFDDDVFDEGDIEFTTACASGNHYFLNGNDLDCEVDDDVPESGDFGDGAHLEADGTISVDAVGTLEVNATNVGATNDLMIVNNSDVTMFSFVEIPDCDDAGGNHLNYDQTLQNFSCGTSGDGAGGIADLEADTIPSLGGDLNITSYKIFRNGTETNMSIDTSGNFIIALG